jgi:hypothetical protein
VPLPHTQSTKATAPKALAGLAWPSGNLSTNCKRFTGIIPPDSISDVSRWQINQPVLLKGCAAFSVPENSQLEVDNLKPAILSVAKETNMDPRFILAILTQESNGCLRVHTTVSPDGTVRNPGPFQDHDGDHTCNLKGDTRAAEIKAKFSKVTWTDEIAVDCPADMINGMIKDGVAGTAAGDGLQQILAAVGGGTVQKRQATVASATVALPSALSTCDAVALAQYSNLVWQNAVLQMQLAYAGSPLSPASMVSPVPSAAPTSAAVAASAPPASSDYGIISISVVPIESSGVPTRFATSVVPASNGTSGEAVATSVPTSAASEASESADSTSIGTDSSTTSSTSSITTDTTTANNGPTDAQIYYKAARKYNSGSIADPKALGNAGPSTPCYVSDIANRLTGWTDLVGESLCKVALGSVVETS